MGTMKTDALVFVLSLVFLAFFWIGFASGKREFDERFGLLTFWVNTPLVFAALIAIVKLLIHAFCTP